MMTYLLMSVCNPSHQNNLYFQRLIKRKKKRKEGKGPRKLKNVERLRRPVKKKPSPNLLLCKKSIKSEIRISGVVTLLSTTKVIKNWSLS